jgi:hypothetical protein
MFVCIVLQKNRVEDGMATSQVLWRLDFVQHLLRLGSGIVEPYSKDFVDEIHTFGHRIDRWNP